METMSYPSSPLIPFPTQHEESSYLLWSPQVVIPPENANMCDGHADTSPVQQQDHEFMDMLIQEANGLLQDDLSNGDPLADFDERLVGQENGNLVGTVEEELMESSLGDLLVAGARAVEAGDSIGASAIMSRFDDLVPGFTYRSYGAAVSPSNHLACYFARGLQSRISGARTESHPTAAPAPENRMPAYRMLQELSPFIKFAHFTANQAILEATVDDPDVHVVDLNIGEGVQWASLMSDLVRHGSKPFHLTAVTTDADPDAGTRSMAARWLSEFAESLSLPFRYSSLHLRSEEDLHDFTKSYNGSVIVSCDTTDKSYSSLIKLQTLLVVSVKILQPKLVILTEEELFRIDRKPSLGVASFAEFFCEALPHFTAMLDSLSSCFCDGGYGVCLGLVEKEMLGPRIEEAVGQYGSVTGGVSGDLEGCRPCEPSSFNIAQAKMLVGLFSRGFGVVHEEGRLALCWNSRPLTSVSVWSPM
ncbi:protein NODULATION SIGNALING PATHWAY 2-like [Phragmites australis]|uniref:protein NODULATION SIGNALING PATHWAY 2-like n=1 Tax=Phragmites australis TaxID=29695 RepID=UPI002D766024|nr:protein NODULATION SIGNALING PATHWAY 2-like [Phragmites australis]